MKHLIFILCAVLFFGCNSSNKPKKPDNLIPKDKMADVIYEVFVLNAAKNINKTVLEKNGISPLDHVYKKYDIDSLQFALSNDYYAFDTKVYEKIMSEVKAKIERDKLKYEAVRAQEEKADQERRELRRKQEDSVPNVKKDYIKPKPSEVN